MQPHKHRCPNPVYFNTLSLIVYLSAIETPIRFECTLLPSILQNLRYMIFKIRYWNHRGIFLGQMPQTQKSHRAPENFQTLQ